MICEFVSLAGATSEQLVFGSGPSRLADPRAPVKDAT